MQVAMEEAVADKAASAPEAMQVSAAADAEVSLEQPAATVEVGSADRLAHMRQDLIHPEYQPAAMANTGKDPTRLELRLERRFTAQRQRHKIGPRVDN